MKAVAKLMSELELLEELLSITEPYVQRTQELRRWQEISATVADRRQAVDNVEQEIKDHESWCGKDCQTFLPTVYRKKRLKGDSKEDLQSDYDSCHAFR